MPKTITPGLATHLGQETTTLATLWHITRVDGAEFFFTDHDVAIVFDGDSYEPSVGYNRTAVSNQVGLSVDNLDVSGFLDSSALTDAELRAGLFDFAEVRISVVNYTNLAQGALRLRRGHMGEVIYNDSGFFQTELRGLTQAYSQQIVELYEPECRADLGDSRCKIQLYPTAVARTTAYEEGDIVAAPAGLASDDREYVCTVAGTTAGSAPTYDPIVGNDTVDGTATFTAREAYTRQGTVTAVTDNRTFSMSFDNGADSREVADWFKYGAVNWETGNNANTSMEVKKNEPSVTTGATLLSVADANTFTRPAGSFLTDGFLVGMTINTTGFANGGNNGTFTISAVGATTLDVAEGGLTAETGSGDEEMVSDERITLFLTMPFEIQAGDTFNMYAGCDKRLNTCFTKFANVLNMRAEPYVPGQDAFIAVQPPT